MGKNVIIKDQVMNDVYKVKEVADKLRVHRNTVLDWIKTGKVKAFRVSKSWRIPREEIERITRLEDKNNVIKGEGK